MSLLRGLASIWFRGEMPTFRLSTAKIVGSGTNLAIVASMQHRDGEGGLRLEC